MTHFSKEYFQKFAFTPVQVDRYFENALRDLRIAAGDKYPEVRFTYSYQALLKTAIAVLAKKAIKVRSVPGHHWKLLEKLSEILGDQDILTIGNAMRMKRNQDLYSGGKFVSAKEANAYLAFVKRVVNQAQEAQ